MIILSKIMGGLLACDGHCGGENVNIPCELQRLGLPLDGRETHISAGFDFFAAVSGMVRVIGRVIIILVCLVAKKGKTWSFRSLYVQF